jgi:hypothetical protein
MTTPQKRTLAETVSGRVVGVADGTPPEMEFAFVCAEMQVNTKSPPN